jgi:hypothetical protein
MNRYSLSYAYYERVSTCMINDSVPGFFSVPRRLFDSTYAPPFVTLTHGAQKLALNANALAGFEGRKSDAAAFISLGPDIHYASPYLDARVQLDVYTTDRLDSVAVEEVAFERFIAGNAAPISGSFDFDFNLRQAWLTLKLRQFELSTGRMRLRWGPGYKATLGLSGVSFSPACLYHARLNFGRRAAFTSFLAGLDDEPSYYDELGRDTDARYLAGQRIDIAIGSHVQLGLYELCDIYGQKDLIRYATPLQIYFLGQNQGAPGANLIGGIDLNVIVGRFRAYIDFLDDDLTFWEDAGNPNKYAWQIGLTAYGRSILCQAGAEYTHVAPYVYGNVKPLSRHTFWGEGLGWPWGNDQDVVSLHAIFAAAKNLHARTEANLWILGDGELSDDWNADGRPDLDHAPYFPHNAKTAFSLVIGAQYVPWYWLKISALGRPMWIDGRGTHSAHLFVSAAVPGRKQIALEKD